MTPTSRSVLKGVLIEVERERDISSNPGSPLRWTPSNWEPVKLLRPSAECRAQRTVQSKENLIAHIFRMQTREAVTQGEQILIARSTQWRQKQKGGRYSISGGWFLKGIAVDHVTSGCPSAGLGLEWPLRGTPQAPWYFQAEGRWCRLAPDLWWNMAPEVWNSLAREPWCCPFVEPLEGMAPQLWEQMVSEVEVEAGRAVSPAAAQAQGVEWRAVSADMNSCFKEGWT